VPFPVSPNQDSRHLENSNGNISMTGSRVGFSGLADRMALFPV